MNEINYEDVLQIESFFRNAKNLIIPIDLMLQNSVVEIVWTKYQRFGIELANPYKKYWQAGLGECSAVVLEEDQPELHKVYCNYLIDGKCIKSEYYLNGTINTTHYISHGNNNEIEYVFLKGFKLLAVTLYQFFNKHADFIIVCQNFNFIFINFKYADDILTSLHYLEKSREGSKISEIITYLKYDEDGNALLEHCNIRDS